MPRRIHHTLSSPGDIDGRRHRVRSVDGDQLRGPERVLEIAQHEELQRALGPCDDLLRGKDVSATTLDFRRRLRQIGGRDRPRFDANLCVGALLFGEREAAAPDVQVAACGHEIPIRLLYIGHRSRAPGG